jgi:8-oxo-dGTP diphosphatase
LILSAICYCFFVKTGPPGRSSWSQDTENRLFFVFQINLIKINEQTIMSRPKTPDLTVDIIIELLDKPGKSIVLIQRKYAPLGRAIPGGFVEVGETVEAAAKREAYEETSLKVTLIKLLGVYSDPARDPRGHSVAVVFVAQAHGVPVAEDDAAATEIWQIDQLPDDLVFDHGQILADYQQWRIANPN